jgi:hypothetical protein
MFLHPLISIIYSNFSCRYCQVDHIVYEFRTASLNQDLNTEQAVRGARIGKVDN